MLEGEPQTDLELALDVRSASLPEAGDLAVGGRGRCGARIPEHRVIEDVVALHPRFETPLAAQSEGTEDRQVRRPRARTVELVPARVAEADAGRLDEGRRIEPLAGIADAAEDDAEAQYVETPCEETARLLLRRRAADRAVSLAHDAEIERRRCGPLGGWVGARSIFA